MTSERLKAIATEVAEHVYNRLISETGIDRVRSMQVAINAGDAAGNSLRQDLRITEELLEALKEVPAWFEEWNVEIGPAEQALLDRVNSAIEGANHGAVCFRCDGKGFTRMDGEPDNAFEGSDYIPRANCPDCDGTGKMISRGDK